MLECACVICHGPIERKSRGPTAVVCGENCHGMWRRVRRGGEVPAKYLQMRALHAYRRELASFFAIVEQRLLTRKAS